MAEIKEACAALSRGGIDPSKVITEKVEKRPHPSTTNEDGEPVKKRWKKLTRYAMLLAYQGKNYCGMQVQKDAPTIEGCLLNAMQKYGLITHEEAIKPNSFFFQRAARTDRAVSAVRQMCSMMLNFNEQLPKTGADELNKLLPDDIRVIGIRRATRTFNAQKDCDARTYSYTLPTYAFAKVDELTSSSYRISDETINEINSLLQRFVGTHNFFNYTSKREFSDRSCFRYIMEFKCGPKFLFKNELRDEHVEFLTITIKGQSFMLHQIRKMIGMVIAISRGLLYKSDIQRSFESARMDVPKAPGLGLLLEKLHYDYYDKKFAKTHEKLGDWGEEIEEKISEVRQRLIVNEILQQEISSQSMMNWLADLVKHDFTILPEDEDPPRKSPLSLASAVAATVKEMMESVAADGVTADIANNVVERAHLEGNDTEETDSDKKVSNENNSERDCASGDVVGSKENLAEGNGADKGESGNAEIVNAPPQS